MMPCSTCKAKERKGVEGGGCLLPWCRGPFVVFMNEREGKSFNWSSIIGIWGIFREKGLIREIGTY